MRRYRIVHDRFSGYEVQTRVWWWPFWVQAGFTNTHESVEEAKDYIRRLNWSLEIDSRGSVVREVQRDTYLRPVE